MNEFFDTLTDVILPIFTITLLVMIAGTLAVRVAVKYYRHRKHEKMLYPLPVKDKAVFTKWVDTLWGPNLLYFLLEVGVVVLFTLAVKYDLDWLIPFAFTGLVATIAIIILCCAYGPWFIGIGSISLIIRHNSCEDNIPYNEIESVKLDTPAADARCIFGLPGCAGYWGTWRDSEHGTYTACYGRRDQCFFVRLKDGRGYMLGCKDPSAIVDRLNAILAEQYHH